MVRPALLIVGLAALVPAGGLSANARPPGMSTPAIASGEYGELMIGVDPATATVTGYYSSSTGRGQFACIFFLTGKLQGSQARITTYYPGSADHVITGTLSARANGQVRVRLKEDHGGCWNVTHFADDAEPADFFSFTPRPWIGVTVVRSKKAFLYDAPDPARHGRAYLVQGDGVGIRARRGGWVRVEFPGERRSTIGWIRQADLYPLR